MWSVADEVSLYGGYVTYMFYIFVQYALQYIVRATTLSLKYKT